MQSAHLAGDVDHPKTVILRIAPDAHNFEPISIADCWLFTAGTITNCPYYVDVVPDNTGTDPTKDCWPENV